MRKQILRSTGLKGTNIHGRIFIGRESNHPNRVSKGYIRKFECSYYYSVNINKDRLAKYADHIEHPRRTQGIGGKVLNALKTNQIVKRERNMYFLNPDLLAKETGLTYEDFRRCLGQDSEQFANFAKSIRENVS